MRIVEGYRGLGPGERGATAAIGNFDGVHRGHQVLIRDARAALPHAPLGVITFEPHPRRHFQPDAPAFRLTTPAEKARLLAAHGVERLYQLGFDAALAGMKAGDFVRDVLADGLGVAHVVVGADFRFGKARKGDPILLRQMGAELGFGVTIQDLVGDESGDFASTALRVLIEQGRCEEAARQLGRWHTVSGKVVQGDQRGRELGYPTANVALGEQLIPLFGVYAAEVTVHDGPFAGAHNGVVSVGVRPTFGVNTPNFEVHLFDFAGDLYGAEVSVGLVRLIRAEMKFYDADTLIAQMDRDSADARSILASANVPG